MLNSDGQRRLLTVFVDGLQWSSGGQMPFLSQMGCRLPLETLLGYSITCHASMYTGVYPETHGVWFYWKYDPAHSPYRFLRDSWTTRMLDSLPVRLLLGKAARMISKNSSYGGLPVMRCSALANWGYMAPSEDRLWSEPGYIPGIPTLFEMLDAAGVSQEWVGLYDGRERGGAMEHIHEYQVPDNPAQWTYLFIGQLDDVSHKHGQDSPEGKALISDIDHQIERVYREMEERTGIPPILMVYSDHGHARVTEKLDLYKHFTQRGRDLRKYIHVVDANFARFWFRNDAEEAQVREALDALGEIGQVLSVADLAHYRLPRNSRDYGDLVYYLDMPRMFKGTVWGYGLRTESIHGYLPEYPEKRGMFATNMQCDSEFVELVDIAPTILKSLGLPIPEHVEGRSLW